MERLNSDIKSGQYKQLYLLYGEEGYLRRNYMKSLKKGIIGDDDMNYTYYEGKDITISAVRDMGDTMPFFAERRLIVIENSGWCKSGGDALADYIDAIPSYLYIVLVEPEVDKRTKLFKKIKNDGTAVEMVAYTGDKQKLWVASLLKKNDKKMTERDIEHLISLTGDDMVNIQSEVDKLVNYVGERQVITARDADDIVTRQIGDHIFKMVDAMGQRNQRLALSYYYDLLSRREAPFKILALVARQFNLLLQTKELVGKRDMDKDIAAKIKVNPYFVKDYKRQAANFDYDTLRRALEACAKADEDIKFGRMSDKLSVELLVVEFSQ